MYSFSSQTAEGKKGSPPATAAGEEPQETGSPAITPEKKSGRRKINIEFIEDKSRRHITFSKRKAGIMKKAYELSTLTGTQVLLLVASETGHVYTFATSKLQPLITKPEGKNLIQACLNAPDNAPPTTILSTRSSATEQSFTPAGDSLPTYQEEKSELPQDVKPPKPKPAAPANVTTPSGSSEATFPGYPSPQGAPSGGNNYSIAQALEGYSTASAAGASARYMAASPQPGSLGTFGGAGLAAAYGYPPAPLAHTQLPGYLWNGRLPVAAPPKVPHVTLPPSTSMPQPHIMSPSAPPGAPPSMHILHTYRGAPNGNYQT